MQAAQTILELFRPFHENEIPSSEDPVNVPIYPNVEESLLFDLCEYTITELSKVNSALIDIKGPMVIVGDIHGNLDDLLRILHVFGLPPHNRYIFLGDFVDRGQYSVAVIAIILSLYCVYPNDIFMIRGNHEFSHINRAYGFFDEIMTVYRNEELWNIFQTVFSYLPLAAIIDESVFCVHGGLSPLLNSVKTLRELPMPILNYLNNTMISDLVWSDPVDTIKGFQLNHRGSGQVFGQDAVEKFLRSNDFKIMVRGHQCTLSGFRPFANFMGITVFSSSNYCAAIKNKCGVISLKEDRMISFYSIESDSQHGLLPRAIMSLPMEGDVGLKRMFRTISRPQLKVNAPEGTPGEGGDDDDDAGSSPIIRSSSVYGKFGGS